MKTILVSLACSALVALAACDKPKPRPGHAPVSAPLAEAPPQPAATPGLTRREPMATFTLDRIGDQPDPLNRPATVAGDEPMAFQGFIFDPAAKAPGRAADVVIDGTAYGATYGQARPDVADYFKAPGLAATGFAVILRPGTLGAGEHTAAIRVVASDGTGYFESAPIRFSVR